MSSNVIRKQWWLAIALSIVMIGALGVSITPGANAQATSPDATIRFVHALAGGGSVDVLLDGNPIAQGLTFGTATTYASLPSGDHGLKVMNAGQDQGQALVDKTITVDGGSAYNVIIGGQPSQPDAQLFQVNLDAVSVGQARYRVIQASPDLGNVNVQLGGSNNGAVTGSNSAAAGGVGFMADSGYNDVTAGTYTINVSTSSGAQTALAAPSINLESGRVYDLVVIGQNSNQSLTLLPLVTDVFQPCGTMLGVGNATDACLRFIHVSPDAGSVDILVDGSVVAKNIGYGTATQFTAVSAADHQIQVVPTGQPASAAVLDKTITFSTGQAYQLSVVGLVAQDDTNDNDLRIHQDEIDLTPIPAGQARVRMVHAVPGGGDASLSTADGAALVDKASFGEATNYQLVNAMSYDLQLQVAQSNNQSPITVNAKGLELKEGMVYDLFVIGRSTDPSSVQILVLTTQASVREGAQGTPVTVASPTPTTVASPVGVVTVTAITGAPNGTVVGTAPSSPIVGTATPTPAS